MASRPRTEGFERGTTPPCRVLVVDDSIVARLVVQRIVNDTGRFEVVGEASSADEALGIVAGLGVDIILLDIEMPGTDGIDAIAPLVARSGGAAILVVSSHCADNADASVRAMTMGASETLLKPGSRPFSDQFAMRLEEAMCRIDDSRRLENFAARTVLQKERNGKGLARPVRAVAIGSSTGGIHALAALFAGLPAELDMPVFISQHLPDEFIPYFAAQMGQLTGRNFGVARDGQLVEPGVVLIAPGDAHLLVRKVAERARIAFQRRPSVSGCCPSADPMFASVAEVYGRDAIGVMLSGMGRDGSEGAKTLAETGAELLVQDRESAAVWGMPGAVARQGIARLIGPPAELADYIVKRARMFGWT
jgi:two-component system chemotaxis response regulator CheB